MTERVFVKYKNYLLALMNMLDIKPLPEDKFVAVVTEIANRLFKAEEGRVFRPLTEMEATLVHLDLSLCRLAPDIILSSMNKNSLAIQPGLQVPSLTSNFLWLTLFREIEPSKILGNVAGGICFDAYMEAFKQNFITDDLEYSVCFSISDDQLCFTFFPKDGVLEKVGSPVHLKNLTGNFGSVGKDFDLEHWMPSDTALKN